jgi:hypothetical protein
MQDKQLKSLSVFMPLEKIESTLSEIGFLLSGTATVVADGKFWKKKTYLNGQETISISDEIGNAYPKDPIITICASQNTISKVIEGMSKSYASLRM